MRFFRLFPVISDAGFPSYRDNEPSLHDCERSAEQEPKIGNRCSLLVEREQPDGKDLQRHKEPLTGHLRLGAG